jgi:hypothetical protein
MIQLNMHKSCGTYSGYTIHIRDRTEICSPCREASRLYQNNKRLERIKALGYDPRRFKRHHVSEEKYKEMLGLYDGKCWVCKTRDGSVIDHDHSCCPKTHSCGKCVRGILCSNCNTAIGLIKEDVEVAKNIEKYLNQTQPNS